MTQKIPASFNDRVVAPGEHVQAADGATVLGLGHLNAELAAEYADFIADRDAYRDDFRQSLDLTARSARSYPRVIVVFGLIRSIDQKCGNNSRLISSQVAPAIDDARIQF